MKDYIYEYANFPDGGLIDVTAYKDVDDSMATLINQINDYRKSGDFTAATNLIKANEDTIRQYSIDSILINRIIQEVYNTQIYAARKCQSIYTQVSEPATAKASDVWIGGV